MPLGSTKAFKICAAGAGLASAQSVCNVASVGAGAIQDHAEHWTGVCAHGPVPGCAPDIHDSHELGARPPGAYLPGSMVCTRAPGRGTWFRLLVWTG
eukprot:scaffold12802_cov21-Tisochrysis_lutea.AAC.2